MAGPSATLNLIPQSVRSRRLTYLASCVGSVVAFQDYVVVAILGGVSVPGAPDLLTDYLAIAFAQFLGAGTSQAAVLGAQQQAAALFLNSQLIDLLYNFPAAGVPIPGVIFPAVPAIPVGPLSQYAPTPNAVKQPNGFATQAALSAATDAGPLRVKIRMSAQKVPNIINALLNNGPPMIASLAAGGSNVEWSAEFTSLGGFPGPAQLVVQAPTGPIGAGAANIASGCYIDIEYGASIAGE